MDRPAGRAYVSAVLSAAMVHATIMVSDMARARAFYVDRLGLEVARDAAPYLFLRAGSGQLALVARTTVTPASNTVCAFEVHDLAATMAALRERGVVFEEYDLPNLRTVGGVAKVYSTLRGSATRTATTSASTTLPATPRDDRSTRTAKPSNQPDSKRSSSRASPSRSRLRDDDASITDRARGRAAGLAHRIASRRRRPRSKPAATGWTGRARSNRVAATR